jgi:hypothetical protein
MNSDAASYDFAPWSVESLRLSVFHPERKDRSGLWARLMGSSPESINERPRDQIFQEEGPAGRNRLFLATQSQRLDWNIVPSLPANADATKLLFLADIDQALSLVQGELEVSARQVQQIDRLAFGAILLQQVDNMSDGMRCLSKYLPFLDLERREGTDLLYQINRRRRSNHVPHVLVNRLSKWSLEYAQSGALVVAPARRPRLETSEPQTVVKLVLDVNTAPENNAISLDRMPILLTEFLGFAQEIATRGDSS